MEKNTHKPAEQFDKISFYIVAHADDWQLFMHPHVYDDLIAPNCKVVFIITTAGDAGMGERYWMAREEGLKSSIRFCLAPHSVSLEVKGNREFNHHSICYWSVNNTTSYFLRLADGNLDGSGFSAGNFQSLSRFRSEKINEIAALDDSAVYCNWANFTTTLESIITFESSGIPDRYVHYLNPDIKTNPDDHSDHIFTGYAIQNMRSITTLHQLLFVGYSVITTPENLSLTDLFWKAGMFAAYEKAVYDICGYSTLKESTDLYTRWCCSRSKFLTILPCA